MAAKLEARVSKHDQEIAAIRKLILQGMKMINALTAAQRKTDAQLRATDAQLKAFVQSMTRGSNGHSKSQ
jgi:Xaa-Pro aminopeptidase